MPGKPSKLDRVRDAALHCKMEEFTILDIAGEINWKGCKEVISMREIANMIRSTGVVVSVGDKLINEGRGTHSYRLYSKKVMSQ